MIWVQAAAALISSFAANKQAKEDAKDARKHDGQMTEKSASLERMNSMFNAEQDYYYDQLGRAAKQRGMDQFRMNSTVTQWDPEHVDENPRIVVPERPIYNEGLYKVIEPPKKKKKKWTLKDMFTTPSLDPANLMGNNEGR